MVPLKVLQLELSPPHTPHLSSCFEEPTVPSQPTFCSWGHGKFNVQILKQMQLACPHTRITSLTSHSPRTHTLWGSLYEHRVPSSTILCMLTTSRVSLDWQCSLQRSLAGRWTHTHTHTHTHNKWPNSSNSCVRMAHMRSISVISSLQPTCDYLLFSEWALHESAWRSLSLCSPRVSHTTSTWASRDKTWQFIPVRMNTPTSSCFFYYHYYYHLFNNKLIISRWQTCCRRIIVFRENTLLSGWTESTQKQHEIPISDIWTCVCEIRFDIRGGPCNYTCESQCR